MKASEFIPTGSDAFKAILESRLEEARIKSQRSKYKLLSRIPKNMITQIRDIMLPSTLSPYDILLDANIKRRDTYPAFFQEHS